MMEKRFLAWLGFGFAAVALMAICGVLIHAISLEFSADKKGDLATWVGAVGTVGTLLFAIYLATAETRAKRKREHQTALIQAADIQLRIGKVVVLLTTMRDEYAKATEKPISAAEIVATGKVLSSARLWTLEDARDLIPLPNNCAVHIAFAGSQFEILVSMLCRAEENAYLKTYLKRMEFAFNVVAYIDNLLISLSAAQTEIKAVLGRASFDASSD